MVRDRVHDSQKMTGYSYRVPSYPVEPGSRPPKEDMVEQFGAGWITPPEQTAIIDYLVAHYGPEK